MRLLPGVMLALFGAAGSLSAQSPAPAWHLGAAVEALRFASAARESAAPAPVDLRPSGRIGLRVGLVRRLGAWSLGASVGYASGDIEASNDNVAIRDRGVDLTRYRFAMDLERRVARLGGGELAVGAGPTVDLWSVSGETRTRVGAEVEMAVRLPLGAVALENRLVFGMSGSPVEESDVGGGFQLSSLKTLGYVVGLRLPL
jgi:hypothetical protein